MDSSPQAQAAPRGTVSLYKGIPLSETTTEGFRDSLEVLLIEPYRFIHAALPALRAGTSPRIVLVTSAAGQRPMPKMTMYAAARAGADAMVTSLARELGRDGVSVFGIAPVYFTSDDTYPRKAFETNERFRASVEKAVPLGRLSSENEMAKLSQVRELLKSLSLKVPWFCFLLCCCYLRPLKIG